MADLVPASKPSQNKNPITRILLLIAGVLSTLIGFAGIFIPLLPTTPFLLLASWCFVRSSDKLDRILKENRFLGPYLKNYREKKGITKRNKIYSLVFLWVSLSVSFYFSPDWWWLWVILLAVGVGVSYHVISFTTLKD
ncbi:MAG TPA: YbaN family protein [Bacteroidales bacterium]